MQHQAPMPQTEMFREKKKGQAPFYICITTVYVSQTPLGNFSIAASRTFPPWIFMILLCLMTKLTVIFMRFMDQRQKTPWLKCCPSASQLCKHFHHFIFVFSFPIPLPLLLCSMCSISLPIWHLGVSEISLKVCWIPLRITSLTDISVKFFHLVPVSIQVLKKTSQQYLTISSQS